VCPHPVAIHVLHHGRDQVRCRPGHVPHPEDHPVRDVFGVGGGREPAGRLLLDDHAPVAGHVIPADGQERAPFRGVVGADQVRRQQDHIEAAAER